MNNTRLNQITESLNRLGTKPNTMYTNQEIIDHLTELQGAMARGVFEKTHAENLRDRDIMIHFEALAREYGLDETDTYLRFKSNMSELGYTIGSFIKGMNGERIAKRALKLLSYDKGIRILYNVQLEDEDVQAEYDAIVVAPYGMFVVEVKNWGTSMAISSNGLLTRIDDSGIIYDLPGRMSVKEALLREYLQDLFPTNYHNMLLLSNEQARVEDNYHKISISCGGGISYEIKSFAKHGNVMTGEQVEKIAETILNNHKEQRALCTVKCDEIIADYAKLMVQIEEASNGATQEIDDFKIPVEEPVFRANSPKNLPWYKRVDWVSVTAGVVILVVPSIVTAVIKHEC
uniref:nuclease-related domain-containing protein n=1 Tax=Agathobacter sp. TaxID=2021311 RepID=UPI0040562D71